MIRAVFFDFDGTLADTAPDMTDALNKWLAQRNRPPVPLARAKKYCSGGVRALLELGGGADGDFETARAEYLDFYEAGGYHQTRLFAGVEAMLTVLTQHCGCRWGVVTNKPRHYFAPIADKLALTEKGAAVLLCGDDLPQAKPAPLPLFTAAQQCRLTAAECLYVGDDPRDAQAAQAAGMGFITAAWGYWQADTAAGEAEMPSDCLLSSPAGMAAAVRYLSVK